jgi:hypothetical protein
VLIHALAAESMERIPATTSDYYGSVEASRRLVLSGRTRSLSTVSTIVYNINDMKLFCLLENTLSMMGISDFSLQ